MVADALQRPSEIWGQNSVEIPETGSRFRPLREGTERTSYPGPDLRRLVSRGPESRASAENFPWRRAMKKE